MLGSLQVSELECDKTRLLTYSTEKFESRDIRWAPDGKGIILIDKDTFCCAFEVEE